MSRPPAQRAGGLVRLEVRDLLGPVELAPVGETALVGVAAAVIARRMS
jgi:hypothetical protein